MKVNREDCKEGYIMKEIIRRGELYIHTYIYIYTHTQIQRQEGKNIKSIK